MNEQLGQPSFHPGPSMKWYTINWLLPPKRSASVSLPPGPSNAYVFSTFSQGISRRCRLSSSRTHENSFSFFNSSFRASSHSACGTILGRSILLFSSLGCIFISSRLGFGSILLELGKRIFVCARPVNRGHWNTQHPQIDRKLPAMVIVMIHED